MTSPKPARYSAIIVRYIETEQHYRYVNQAVLPMNPSPDTIIGSLSRRGCHWVNTRDEVFLALTGVFDCSRRGLP
jgi:hypothetical protein